MNAEDAPIFTQKWADCDTRPPDYSTISKNAVLGSLYKRHPGLRNNAKRF
jgi:hypothetical protein